MTNLTWRRLPNGDRQATQHPIRLIKPLSKRQGEGIWLVKVPFGRDSNFEDGWLWTSVANPDYADERGGTWLKADSYDEVRAVVAEHLDYILSQIPAVYGEPEDLPEVPAVEGATKRYRQIAGFLRREIKDGLYPPGSAIPSENDLMSRFSVARATVRQAVSVLIADGLVVAQHGRGVFVLPEDPVDHMLAQAAEATPGAVLLTTETPCACKCGEMVPYGRVYKQGHDARHRDVLIDLLVGRSTVRDRADRIQHLIDGLRGR